MHERGEVGEVELRPLNGLADKMEGSYLWQVSSTSSALSHFRPRYAIGCRNDRLAERGNGSNHYWSGLRLRHIDGRTDRAAPASGGLR